MVDLLERFQRLLAVGLVDVDDDVADLVVGSLHSISANVHSLRKRCTNPGAAA